MYPPTFVNFFFFNSTWIDIILFKILVTLKINGNYA